MNETAKRTTNETAKIIMNETAKRMLQQKDKNNKIMKTQQMMRTQVPNERPAFNSQLGPGPRTQGNRHFRLIKVKSNE